jgi:hypothetical protein
VEAIVAPPFPVAVPVSVAVLTGNVIVCALPASTVGGATAAFTVTLTVAVDVKPLLSFTVNWNT